MNAVNKSYWLMVEYLGTSIGIDWNHVLRPLFDL